MIKKDGKQFIFKVDIAERTEKGKTHAHISIFLTPCAFEISLP